MARRAPRSGAPSALAGPGGGWPPRPSLPPSLLLPPSSPVVFLSSPGCAQPEPHRTWAGGSRPGRSRQLNGAPEARSPCARSRLPGGPGRGESTPDPSSGRESPPTDCHLPILSLSLRPTSGSARLLKTIIPFAIVWKNPSLLTSAPRALLFTLQPFGCDPHPQGSVRFCLDPSPAALPSCCLSAPPLGPGRPRRRAQPQTWPGSEQGT